MTLGLSTSGAIKIKTDEAGGGLRAVECACCGSLGIDPCSMTLLPTALLDIINNATSVSATFNLPEILSAGYIEAVSGDTGPIVWDGARAFWVDYSIWEEPYLLIELKGNYLHLDFQEVGAALRWVTLHDKDYQTGPTFPCYPTDPDDPFIQWQFFTIEINGFNLPAWQRPRNVGSIPPADYPVPTMSIAFS